MVLEDIGEVLDILTIAYPKWYKNMTDNEKYDFSCLWAGAFVYDNAKQVVESVKQYIYTDEKGFPPVIGQIKGIIARQNLNNQLEPQEAWQLIKKACSKSEHVNGGTRIHVSYQKSFEELPKELQKMIGSPNTLREYALMPMNELESIVGSHFQRNYRAVQINTYEQVKLSGNMQKSLEE